MVKYLDNLMNFLFVLLLFCSLSYNDCNNKIYLILSYNIITLLFIYNYSYNIDNILSIMKFIMLIKGNCPDKQHCFYNYLGIA